MKDYEVEPCTIPIYFQTNAIEASLNDYSTNVVRHRWDGACELTLMGVALAHLQATALPENKVTPCLLGHV